MNLNRAVLAVGASLTIFVAGTAEAGSGLLGLDHYVTYDDSGIWGRNNQLLLVRSMMVAEVAAGVWEGGDTRFGRTMWKSIDATLIGGVTAETMKRVFSRSRPEQSPDPNLWFQGSGHESFPSSEVTVVAAIVTPVIF